MAKTSSKQTAIPSHEEGNPYEAVGRKLCKHIADKCKDSFPEKSKFYYEVSKGKYKVPDMMMKYSSEKFEGFFCKATSELAYGLSDHASKIDVYIIGKPTEEDKLSYFLNKAE